MEWQFSTVLRLCYLLEIFAKLGENEVLQARPSSIHFNGITVGKVHSRKLVSLNHHHVQYFLVSKAICVSFLYTLTQICYKETH